MEAQTPKGHSVNERMLRWTFRVSSILPAVWICLFFAFVAATWLEVGHIPAYGSPDPKDTLLAWFFMPAVLLMLPLAMASIITWIMLTGLGLVNWLPSKPNLKQLLLIMIPILIFFWIRFQTGLFVWLGD